jgi:hypothetical protein
MLQIISTGMPFVYLLARTVEFVLEPASRGKLNTFRLHSWQYSVENQREQVISQHLRADIPACQAPYPICGPSNISFEILDCQGRGRERGRDWTA